MFQILGIGPNESYYSSPTTASSTKINSTLTITENYPEWKAVNVKFTNSFVQSISTGGYLKATRFVRCWNGGYVFGLCTTSMFGGDSSALDNNKKGELFGVVDENPTSGGCQDISTYGGLMPIVTIPTNINIITCNGTNSASNMHTIEGL